MLICVSYNYIVASLDSTAQTGKSGCDDWREEAYQKVISNFLITSCLVEKWLELQNKVNQLTKVKGT